MVSPILDLSKFAFLEKRLKCVYTQKNLSIGMKVGSLPPETKLVPNCETTQQVPKVVHFTKSSSFWTTDHGNATIPSPWMAPHLFCNLCSPHVHENFFAFISFKGECYNVKFIVSERPVCDHMWIGKHTSIAFPRMSPILYLLSSILSCGQDIRGTPGSLSPEAVIHRLHPMSLLMYITVLLYVQLRAVSLFAFKAMDQQLYPQRQQPCH